MGGDVLFLVGRLAPGASAIGFIFILLANAAMFEVACFVDLSAGLVSSVVLVGSSFGGDSARIDCLGSCLGVSGLVVSALGVDLVDLVKRISSSSLSQRDDLTSCFGGMIAASCLGTAISCFLSANGSTLVGAGVLNSDFPKPRRSSSSSDSNRLPFFSVDLTSSVLEGADSFFGSGFVGAIGSGVLNARSFLIGSSSSSDSNRLLFSSLGRAAGVDLSSSFFFRSF